MADDEGEILMGCWDCGACHAQRIRGDSYQCSGCGAPRPANVKFYLPEDAEVVSDQQGIQAALAGVDWQCAFCDSWMSATQQACTNCQASHADTQRRQVTTLYDAEQVPRDSQPEPDPGREVQNPSRSSASQVPAISWVWVAPILLGLAAILVCGGVFAAFRFQKYRVYQAKVEALRQISQAAERKYAAAEQTLNAAQQKVEQAKRDVARAEQAVVEARRSATALETSLQNLQNAAAAKVAAHQWTVRLDLEEVAPQPGEGWSHPNDAIDVRSEQRTHHHERVLDHVDTLYRTESYQEQDGFRTEQYTERVAAGTREVPDGFDIEDLGNGRFQKTPRYRSETVYETVTKTRQEPNIVTKTRQVPYSQEVFRQDPVMQPWYTYQTLVWRSAPALTRSGAGIEPLDPADAPPTDPKKELGAKRVRSRTVSYTLQVDSGAASPTPIAVNRERWLFWSDGAAGLLLQNSIITAEEQQASLAELRGGIELSQALIAEREAQPPLLQAKIAPLEQALPPLQATLQALSAGVKKENRTLQAAIDTGY